MARTRFAHHRLVPATAGRRLPHGGQRPRRGPLLRMPWLL